jgi:cyclopropane-fatty-acyl-phospholipid synthase
MTFPRPILSAELVHRFARRLVLARLRGIREGRITLVDPEGTVVLGGDLGALPLDVRCEVRDLRFWTQVAFGGTVGFSEGWLDGLVGTNDLVGLIRIFVRNRHVMDGLEEGLARASAPLRKLASLARRNTRRGSRRNIAAHYDLGNAFFALFLDETMTYSCGFFEREESTMLEASHAKIERLCRKLELGPGDHLLEIGTGWGAFAIQAAQRFGCRVTTTTISREQHRYATEKVRAAGLAGRVTVLFEDYRDLRGTYDKLVSVEMIEAVGQEYLPGFFAKIASLLPAHGQAALQSITCADQVYEEAAAGVDFIKQYVFPGSTIPSVTALAQAATQASDLRIVDLEDLTSHYARTLHLWRDAFLARVDDVRRLGYPEELVRLWDLYLAYCEGGMEERKIGNVQLLLTRPLCRRGAVAR